MKVELHTTPTTVNLRNKCGEVHMVIDTFPGEHFLILLCYGDTVGWVKPLLEKVDLSISVFIITTRWDKSSLSVCATDNCKKKFTTT